MTMMEALSETGITKKQKKWLNFANPTENKSKHKETAV
jgi:hypothetical protein